MLFGKFSLLFLFFFLQGDVIVHWNLLVNKHMKSEPENPQLGNCESLVMKVNSYMKQL